jgi:hypothetical protein
MSVLRLRDAVSFSLRSLRSKKIPCASLPSTIGEIQKVQTHPHLVMPSGVTLNGVRQLTGVGSDPIGQKRIQKEVICTVSIEDVS